MVGVRPISVVGAEFAYATSGTERLNGLVSTDVTMKGASAFGIFYLPVPIVDIYAKAGVRAPAEHGYDRYRVSSGAFCIATPARLVAVARTWARGRCRCAVQVADCHTRRIRTLQRGWRLPGLFSVGSCGRSNSRR